MIPLGFIRRAYSPIGVEITDVSIAAAQWKYDNHGRSWVAGVRYDRRAVEQKTDKKQAAAPIISETEAITLAGILRRQGFKGKDIVACAPDARLMTASLELPPKSSGAPVAQIAGAELARMHRREPGRLRTQFWQVASPSRAGAGEAMHAMAIGIEMDDALTLSRSFDAAGLSLIAIDARCWGLARVAKCLLPATDEASAAVTLDVGESSTVLAVIRFEAPASGGSDAGSCEVVYERSIVDMGRRAIRERLCERTSLDLSTVDLLLRPGGLAGESDLTGMLAREVTAVLREYAEILAGEVAAASSYTAHRYPVTLSGILVSGTAMEIPGLADSMRAKLPIPPETFRVVRPTALMERHVADAGASICEMRSSDAGLTSACGLALYPKEAAA